MENQNNVRRVAGKIKRTITKKANLKLSSLKGLITQNITYHTSFSQKVNKHPNTKVAVVIHLFYVESWPMFLTHLKCLNEPYDIFITLTNPNIGFGETIKETHPQAYIYEIPNRGRDVLPFIKLLPILIENKYDYVLKIHSKKSTHRKDGKDWFSEIISSLLPTNLNIYKELFNLLKESDCGIVGPVNQYLSLVVNFEANGTLMTNVLNELYNHEISYKVLQTSRKDYGFFAGTMFWARLDVFKPILNIKLPIRKFASEQGQIDATLAHALERIFSLVCEIDGRKLYEISSNNIKAIIYKTDNIPDWSDVYIGPKPG